VRWFPLISVKFVLEEQGNNRLTKRVLSSQIKKKNDVQRELDSELIIILVIQLARVIILT